ncbi:MAG: hypothetical protein R2854_27045 [Caldilineaceae bacterium]
MGETMMLGLRLIDEGVTFARFRQRHGVDMPTFTTTRWRNPAGRPANGGRRRCPADTPRPHVGQPGIHALSG